MPADGVLSAVRRREVAQSGSNTVSVYITSSYGEGAIGYDEYAYALNSHWPVVAVVNPAGYYVLPTASNVAVALTQAQINEDSSSQDFLQQDLDNVYTYKDPRSYPLSSYSYLVVPRSGRKNPPNFSNGVGNRCPRTSTTTCARASSTAAELGYSPLPINLVGAASPRPARSPATSPHAEIYGGCDNPTLKNGKLVLLADAPFPTKCQKAGAPLTARPATPSRDRVTRRERLDRSSDQARERGPVPAAARRRARRARLPGPS